MWLEAKDDQDAVETEEFYAGGGQVARRGLEHFPQLWCPSGRYSVYGQARALLCRVESARAQAPARIGLCRLPRCVYTGLSSESNGHRALVGSNDHRALVGSNGHRAVVGSNGQRALVVSDGVVRSRPWVVCRSAHAGERPGRQLFFTPLSQALRLVIHLGEPLPPDALDRFSTDARALLLFFGLPYALMMWTNGVGASTGMFVPALAVGATGARPPPGSSFMHRRVHGHVCARAGGGATCARALAGAFAALSWGMLAGIMHCALAFSAMGAQHVPGQYAALSRASQRQGIAFPTSQR